MGGGTAAIIFCHKDGDDGKDVVGEFGAVIVGGGGVLIVAENQEFAASLLKEPFEEFLGEAAEAVSVENHKFLDRAGEDAFQKGEQTLAAEVDTGTDIGDNLDAGATRFEEVDLALEVGFLVVGGDAGIGDGNGGGLRRGVGRGEELVNVGKRVKMLASRQLAEGNLAGAGPGS
jgi:hypothetical protein